MFLLLLLVHACFASQDAAELDVDDCAFLTVSRSVRHGIESIQSTARREQMQSGASASSSTEIRTQETSTARAAKVNDEMAKLVSVYERQPVALLQLLDKIVDHQKQMADEVDDEAERRKLALLALDMKTSGHACNGDEGPCWSQKHTGPLQHDPPYPFEPLLDADYISESNNYLEKWMYKHWGKHLNETEKSEKIKGKDKSATVKTSSFLAECHAVSAETPGVGDKCFFGISEADEGAHCIYDQGRYGAYGWCYTKKDKSRWGSCLETCTVRGPPKVLKLHIDRLSKKLKDILKELNSKSKKTG